MMQLIKGDCLVEMNSIADKSIDIDQELWNKMKNNINYYL